jgi:hypothetical protein
MIPLINSCSFLRVTAIQIDVHPAGETRPTRHTHPMLSPRMVPDYTYLTRSMYSNLLRSRQQQWAEPLLPRKGLPTQSTTRRLTDPRIRT